MDQDRKPGSRDVTKRFGRAKHKVNKHGYFPLAGQSRKTPEATVVLVHAATPLPDDPRTGLRAGTPYSLNKAKRWELEAKLEADPAVAVRHEVKNGRALRDPPVKQMVNHRQALVDAQAIRTYAAVVKQSRRGPEVHRPKEPTPPPAAVVAVPLEAVYEVRRDPTRAERQARAVHTWHGCQCCDCKRDSWDRDSRSSKKRELVEQTFM